MKQTARNSRLLKIGLGFLILIPALVVFSFGYRLHRYHSLLEKYECKRDLCKADFDGDAVPGTLSIERLRRLPRQFAHQLACRSRPSCRLRTVGYSKPTYWQQCFEDQLRRLDRRRPFD